jgi:hypothetical protein
MARAKNEKEIMAEAGKKLDAASLEQYNKNQASDSVLHGVQIVELGAAEGHDFEIGRDFLQQVVEVATKLGVVKVRANHPEGRGDVLSIVGEASNFTLDGDCVRADVKMFDVPTKDTILALAREAGHLFGMSLDFAGETVKKAGSKLKQMTCEKIFAVDFVDTPAATRALFSAGDDKNYWRLVCQLSALKVEEKKQVDKESMETRMKKETLSSIFKRFGINPEAQDAEQLLAVKLAEVPKPHDEPDGDEGNEKILAAIEGIEKRLSVLEGKGEENEELAEDKSVEKDEETEEKMATMAAKVCSIMLARVGIKTRGASAPAEDGKGEELSTEEIKLCAGLKMDEAERKQFAANLAKSKQVKF